MINLWINWERKFIKKIMKILFKNSKLLEIIIEKKNILNVI